MLSRYLYIIFKHHLRIARNLTYVRQSWYINPYTIALYIYFVNLSYSIFTRCPKEKNISLSYSYNETIFQAEILCQLLLSGWELMFIIQFDSIVSVLLHWKTVNLSIQEALAKVYFSKRERLCLYAVANACGARVFHVLNWLIQTLYRIMT